MNKQTFAIVCVNKLNQIEYANGAADMKAKGWEPVVEMNYGKYPFCLIAWKC